ncbi:L,D-transpeptidase family protein [Sphingomonadaceae bacterium OTU29MARTA1]|uniref:L,D-transpeptidase family protein n=1 Tax=Sphingomonas sp. Leaf37 TaxID=2876552 RepID=UPI001E5A55F5|nr:L,D-transpeptidase family protein [Sphingomonas sp. Leaf37]USU08125.1 L,D-transpeptidase family protein [Sphingomonadaceae bacterium OTU29MARTA1]
MKQWLVMAGAAILAMAPASAMAAADALAPEVTSLAPNRFLWNDNATLEPVSIVISIPDQKAYVYRGELLIGASTVSTGKDGKDTPLGVFPILQKSEKHRSNLYDDAPMPFMQRLTWDGVAIHAGMNPGFPASHGCIRVPTQFAKKLFAVTSKGTPVLVTDASAAEGWTPPTNEDAQAMQAETASANASFLRTAVD